MSSPTGEQFLLDDGNVRVEIGALAAVLREVRVGGVRITETVPAHTLPSHGCGIVLAPWPNRVKDARWMLNGNVQQLDITDVARASAIHGLLRNTAYTVRERTDRSLTLGATVFPQHGWPFTLDTWVTYALEHDGISVTHGATNQGAASAPWAVGAHPYFRVGENTADEMTVRIAGETRLELDDRLNPVAEHSVAGTQFDLRSPQSLAGADFNVGFGQLSNREARQEVAWLEASDGAATSIWADPAFGWLQLFTPADFPGAEGPHRAVALEPMTAPPDALNSGIDLRWLDSGESFECSWGARYRGPQR
ncbi:aldose 1-epimerase family protein [Microbacterium sp. NPDC076911]|uniref:aldose 1-epimerase family protein n=1 Tax=Microbacterium sp. NPDC076911 TaxID=3154958 RepID=UPI00342D5987